VTGSVQPGVAHNSIINAMHAFRHVKGDLSDRAGSEKMYDRLRNGFGHVHLGPTTGETTAGMSVSSLAGAIFLGEAIREDTVFIGAVAPDAVFLTGNVGTDTESIRAEVERLCNAGHRVVVAEGDVAIPNPKPNGLVEATNLVEVRHPGVTESRYFPRANAARFLPWHGGLHRRSMM
jgi:hypothetical protein